ncbi:MAG: metallophosphoesterase [Desulfomonilaceae bacterium]
MLRIITVLLAHGIIVIPMQYYTIASIREIVFQYRVEWSRRSQLYIIAVLVIANLVLLCITLLGIPFLSPDFDGRQILAVGYFSSVAVVALLCLLFASLQTLNRIFSLSNQRLATAKQPCNAIGGQRGDRWRVANHLSAAPEGGNFSPESAPSNAACGGDQGLGDSKRRPLIYASDVSRRSFLRFAGLTGVAATFGAAGYGLREGYQNPVLNEYKLFHPTFEGMTNPVTIVQVTDLHFGWYFGANELENLVERLNSIAADAVVLTGDIFHSRFTAVEVAEPTLRKLIPRRYGNYAVMGNHERYVGTKRSLASFRRSNLIHLGDKWVSLKNQSATIHLAGLDDLLQEWPPAPESETFQELMDKSPKGPGMRILLCHRPSILPLASYRNFDLVLAGHTHGGQMIIPLPGHPKGFTPASFFSYYTHGWYRKFHCRMYVNEGAGLIFFPWRINCPPEIGIFHLVPRSTTVTHVRRAGGEI